MKLLALFTLFVLVSCGKPANDSSSKKPAPVVQNASILNKFTAVDPATALHGLTELDFSAFELNTFIDATGNCTGTQFGNAGLVNGVPEGFAELQGNYTEGVLQFGHLPYLNPLDQLCRGMSKESYNYTIVGKKLTLCMVNYHFCADYTVVE